MIQFNLLPDIKLEYLKTERTKQLVFSISVIVAGVSLAIILLLFSALELQSHQVSSNKNAIKVDSAKLTGTTDINKILTIQNQLKTVIGLHNKTPLTSRIYDYLPQLVPANVNLQQLTIDLNGDTMNLSGSASDLTTVNTFVDTLKFATYTTDQNTKGSPTFKSVVLNSFGVGQNSTSFSISMQFDPALFDRSQNVKLVVPSDYVSTRSFTQLPSQDIFKNGDTGGSGQ